MERYVTLLEGEKIKLKEPVRIRRDYFWLWEYWALKEHMAMTRCDTWEQYVTKVLMAMKMPSREWKTEPEIEERPGENESRRSIIMKIPLKKIEFIDGKRTALLRSWREFMLYGALKEGLIADHYLEINGGRWPLENDATDGKETTKT